MNDALKLRSTLQCVATCCSVLISHLLAQSAQTTRDVASCCRMLQRVAACSSELQIVTVYSHFVFWHEALKAKGCCSVPQRVEACYSVLQCVAACCSVLSCTHTSSPCTKRSNQHVAVCCSLLTCVASCSSELQRVVMYLYLISLHETLKLQSTVQCAAVY